MFKPLLANGLVLIFALPGLAVAQAVATSSPAAAPQASAAKSFSSALDTYKPFTEEKTIDWKQANDLTARVGGWRAYAKEASGAESASTPAKP